MCDVLPIVVVFCPTNHDPDHVPGSDITNQKGLFVMKKIDIIPLPRTPRSAEVRSTMGERSWLRHCSVQPRKELVLARRIEMAYYCVKVKLLFKTMDPPVAIHFPSLWCRCPCIANLPRTTSVPSQSMCQFSIHLLLHLKSL